MTTWCFLNANYSFAPQEQQIHQSFPSHLYRHQHSDTLICDLPRLDSYSRISRILQANSTVSTGIDCSVDFMQSDTWGGLAPLNPKPAHHSHQRESSLSSLGSTEPASPYAPNTPVPSIALADSGFDGISEMRPSDLANHQTGSYYMLSKTLDPASHPLHQPVDDSISEVAYPMTIMTDLDKKSRRNKGLLPGLYFSDSNANSRPTTHVVSSAGGESLITSEVRDTNHASRRKAGYNHIPKLDRTMTDIYGDELYSPNFAITSTSSPKARSVTSASSDVFSQRITAANHQHLSAAQSPTSTGSRARSPFRAGSPFSISPAPGTEVAHFGGSTRTWKQEDHDHQRTAALENNTEPETPKTISPKDAVLEFNEAEADGVIPLFPQDSSNFEIDTLSKRIHLQDADGSYIGTDIVSFVPNNHLGYLPSQVPTGIRVPQQYPFVAHPSTSHDSPPRLSSSRESSLAAGAVNPTTSRGRPTETMADSGTYTCTYHGCTLRFETPTLLQKHKREGHRQASNLVTPRVQDMGLTSNILDTQAGPHRCDRVNPSTGKACNTVFSRPYDLTRHEDTIHNARKRKVRCDLCTEEKTFSRADALTRHYRVCHPDRDLPVKSRRRAAA